jgi:hypothetical protein
MGDQFQQPDHQRSDAPLWPAKVPREARLRIARHSAWLSLGERRTKKAGFFLGASLLVGFTVAGWPGVLACGLFGGSMFAVVIVLRMERHIRAGVQEYQDLLKSEDLRP